MVVCMRVCLHNYDEILFLCLLERHTTFLDENKLHHVLAANFHHFHIKTPFWWTKNCSDQNLLQHCTKKLVKQLWIIENYIKEILRDNLDLLLYIYIYIYIYICVCMYIYIYKLTYVYNWGLFYPFLPACWDISYNKQVCWSASTSTYVPHHHEYSLEEKKTQNEWIIYVYFIEQQNRWKEINV